MRAKPALRVVALALLTAIIAIGCAVTSKGSESLSNSPVYHPFGKARFILRPKYNVSN
jgi:hypothetical protein